MRVSTVLLLVTALFAPVNVMALDAASGKDAFSLLDAVEFKAALAAPTHGIVLLDARPVDRYLDGHIKGAINIFAPDLEKDPTLLKAGKEEKILVYCDGVKCDKQTNTTQAGLPCRSIEAILPTKSGKAAMTLVKQGYKDVAVLYVGFPGWDAKGYEAFVGKGDSKRLEMPVLTAMELKAVIAAGTGKDLVVDLRPPSEYAKGHVPGASNMPYAAFVVNAGTLNKGKRVIVYGSSDEQGHSAVRRLQKLGFERVARATFAEWQTAGMPVETE